MPTRKKRTVRREALRSKRKELSEKKKRLKHEIGMLCAKGEDGRVLKSYITTENFKRLKTLLRSLEIELAQEDQRSFSYRQYCKLFESYMFKSEKCNGKICCQAITEDGTRCQRHASSFTSMDLTGVQLTPKIPDFVKKHVGAKNIEELKLIGFSNSCCFYCWQHAAMFIAEKTTWATNLGYYTTHPEDLVSIFYTDVRVKKIFGTATYKIEIHGDLKSPDEIIRDMYHTYGITHGATTSTYWGIFLMVYFYNSIRPALIKVVDDYYAEERDISRDMAMTAADALLLLHE